MYGGYPEGRKITMYLPVTKTKAHLGPCPTPVVKHFAKLTANKTVRMTVKASRSLSRNEFALK